MDERSARLRELVLDGLEGGGRGHVGPSLSLIEILRVLYDDVLRVDPANPRWPDRDRLILSKGHGCLALYAVLADRGFFHASELAKFCRPGALLGGHPTHKIPGVEFSTGSLGHGLAVGVGMALAARMQKRPSRVFVVMGDGELQEGSVWEAALVARQHKLTNLTAIIDRNGLQAYGPTEEIAGLRDLESKLFEFGFSTWPVDGHDVDGLRETFARLPFSNQRPSCVICRTVKGKGLPEAEGNPAWHHKAKISAEDVAALRRQLRAVDAP